MVFQNGKTILAHVIMHCTGYKYHFPFLETNGSVTVNDNCVGPLYKHIFSPAFAPSLSFVGITWKVQSSLPFSFLYVCYNKLDFFFSRFYRSICLSYKASGLRVFYRVGSLFLRKKI